MKREDKISTAFKTVLAESGPNDKCDAIVIYKTQIPDRLPARGRSRLRNLKKSLAQFKSQSVPIRAKLFEDYQKESAKRLPHRQHLSVAPIGEGALPVATVEVTSKTLSALAEQPDIVAVLPDQKIRPIEPKRVEYSSPGRQESRNGLTWGLQHLDIPKLWDTTKGQGINVAVLDTGVYSEHPALAGRIKDFVVTDSLARRISAKPSFDAGQHGTHVCGTIAGGRTPRGVSIGIAPEANLLVAGVLIGQSTLRNLIEGITWAIEKGADIINMSLGFSYYDPNFAVLFEILIEQYNILPVVAVGNENQGSTSSPGNASNALSVGAVEKIARRKTDVAFFSSGASLVFPGENPDVVTKPDVVAPGVRILSCIPPQTTPQGTLEYSYMDGTSMATPHVAGVAALLMAAKPKASVSNIMEVLKKTAKHPDGGKRRPDNRWGYGLIQPVKALSSL